MLAVLVNVLKGEAGATLVEYGLLVSLIAVACIIVVRSLGTQISKLFQSIDTAI